MDGSSWRMENGIQNEMKFKELNKIENVMQTLYNNHTPI